MHIKETDDSYSYDYDYPDAQPADDTVDPDTVISVDFTNDTAQPPDGEN